jgi:hypothetical protein
LTESAESAYYHRNSNIHLRATVARAAEHWETARRAKTDGWRPNSPEAQLIGRFPDDRDLAIAAFDAHLQAAAPQHVLMSDFDWDLAFAIMAGSELSRPLARSTPET